MVEREEAKKLFRRFRSQRSGIRKSREMGSICLICGSADVVPLAGQEPSTMHCRNCGFEFVRYVCKACGETVDGRDSDNPCCRTCGWRICVCSVCHPDGCSAHELRMQAGAEQ